MDIYNIGGTCTYTLLATLAATLITKKFHLDTIYYGIIFSLVMSSLNNATFDVSQLSIKYTYAYAYPVACIIIITIVVYKYKGFLLNTVRYNTKYTTIKLFNGRDVEIFKDYIIYNPKIFTDLSELNIGDVDDEWSRRNNSPSFSNSIIGDYDIPQAFKDTNFDVEGLVTWRKFKKTFKDQNKNSENKEMFDNEWIHIYPEFKIDKKLSKINFVSYLGKINSYVSAKNDNTSTLTSTKVFFKDTKCDSNHVVTFYKGPKTSLKERKKTFIDSFFHKEKKRLWNTLKNVHYHPEKYESYGQSPRINLLLHGPPGSGKSSMIFRLARCLERDIISIDLRDTDSKKQIYQIIQRPVVNGCNGQAKDVIIVLEEIDMAIKELNNRSMLKDKLNIALSSTYDKIINDDKDDDISKLNRVRSEYPSERFVLRDLLDIFQGTIPVNGSIIIATTNKFNEIKNICPELFRNGRMTPVYFGYLDKKYIQKMSKYYFGRELDIKLKDKPNIPTSTIVELAMEMKIMYDDKNEAFDHFQEKMTILLDDSVNIE